MDESTQFAFALLAGAAVKWISAEWFRKKKEKQFERVGTLSALNLHWMITRPNGDFLTQRQEPKMALITASIHGFGETISKPWTVEKKPIIGSENSCNWKIYIWYAQQMAAFADFCGYLVLPDASVQDLNTRLSSPVTIKNFRPNIVVAGTNPFDEDNWEEIKIGDDVYLRSDVFQHMAIPLYLVLMRHWTEVEIFPLEILFMC
ncbi:hypothetical protein KUTeg_013847 [Tegillarca granosa]|uniref:MOSC domain-containing protein n=1 Tax=Tegillarca granosa TaxID=220873 RepID=A0ABQ9EUU9_TEGGR|nr:hypothetical protein KUTeg_013847 [Tegillarca granosa]